MNPIAILSFVAFLATIPLSNLALSHFGTCGGTGPCVIPVAPDIMAPSGVVVIGVALVLRDYVHRTVGPTMAMVAILLGAALSMVLSPAMLAIAAAGSFLLSEMADFLVYARLRRRWPSLAVLMSGIVGAVVDSILFLWLAFGSLDYLLGQTIGKLWASVIAAIVLRAVIAIRSQRRGVPA